MWATSGICKRAASRFSQPDSLTVSVCECVFVCVDPKVQWKRTEQMKTKITHLGKVKNFVTWHVTRCIEFLWNFGSILSAERNVMVRLRSELKIGLEVHETAVTLSLSRVGARADGTGDGAWSWRTTTLCFLRKDLLCVSVSRSLLFVLLFPFKPLQVKVSNSGSIAWLTGSNNLVEGNALT